MVSVAVYLLALVPLALCSPTSHIVGGSPVDIADYNYQGSYRTGTGSHSCGCVFVGGQFALTAGHCGGSTAYTMEFGNSNRGTGPYTGVAEVLRHPDYNVGPGFTPNDISIVTISGAVQGNPTAGVIAPNADNPGGSGWITGWGRTCGSCALPIALQGTQIPIITDALCSELHGTSFQASSMICVWDEVGKQIGACNGDSGGPLGVNGTIYGLTSWGRSGCLTTFPSAYNRVGAFNSWICTNSEGVRGC